MSLYTEHVASRAYVCDRGCGEPIEPDSRYVRAALPPWAEPNESDGWWTMRLHGRRWEDCPAHTATAIAKTVARDALRQSR